MLKRYSLWLTKKFSRAKSSLTILEFDELHTLKVSEDLYEDLEEKAKSEYLRLAIDVYQSAFSEAGGDKKSARHIPSEKWVEKILDRYDPVLEYVFMNEAERKEQRFSEDVLAKASAVSGMPSGKRHKIRPGKSEPLTDAPLDSILKKHMSLWNRQISWEADILTDESHLKAWKDKGIRQVMWVTQKDDKVCDECAERDGVIYDIDQIPTKPHPHCRCYYKPV